MRRSSHFVAAGLFLGLASPSLSADMAVSYAPKTPSGQCQGFLGKPITDDMLPAMHDAGCCDVLVAMYETAAVNALERRLQCPAWHHYKSIYGEPPVDFESLDAVDVPADLVAIVIPPATDTVADEPQPPLPLPDPPRAPVSVPWTMMNAPAEFPEGVEWPEGYVPGPLNLGN